MRFPWQSETPAVETRAADYSDSLIDYLVQQALGLAAQADHQATAALEMACGLVGRGFLAAEVTADSETVRAAIAPMFLEMVSRAMVRSGEIVYHIDTSGGALMLVPALSHNVNGGPSPSTWEYDLTVSGPSRTWSYQAVPASGVLHFRYAAHKSTPWRGQSAIEVAHLSGKLSAATVKALGDEASGPVGRMMGLPVDGDSPEIAKFKRDIAGARGGLATIENGDWDTLNGAAVDLNTKRFGADPPDGLVALAQQASNEIVAAVGINPAMFISGDSASLREAWRLALFGVIAPLGRSIERELRDKLDASLTLDWQELRASDLSGRARAFQSLVGGGMPVPEAAAQAGVLSPDRE